MLFNHHTSFHQRLFYRLACYGEGIGVGHHNSLAVRKLLYKQLTYLVEDACPNTHGTRVVDILQSLLHLQHAVSEKTGRIGRVFLYQGIDVLNDIRVELQ